MGKGSVPRPFDIPQDQFISNWERTFGQREKQIQEEEKKSKEDAPKDNAK